MKTEVLNECKKTADRIINILNGMGYSTDVKPAYPNLLKDLLVIELKRNITAVTTEFYNSVAVVPVETKDEDEQVSPI
jgi:hypothetical protein